MSYSDDEITTYSYEDEDEAASMLELKKEVQLLIMHNSSQVSIAGRENNSQAKLYQELQARMVRLANEYIKFTKQDTD